MATSPADVKDPRIDRLISWALTTIAALAFSAGAWAFNDQRGEFRAMRDELTKVSTRLSVLEGLSSDLPMRVRGLESDAANHRAKIESLERDIEALKRKP